MALTYAQLVVAVSDYCENTFNTTDMNTMIKQAEQRIYNTVQIANLRKNVTGTITSGNKYLSCPDDFLSVYSIAIYPNAGGNYIYLLNKDVNFMRDAYPNPASTGTPKHYAIFGPQSTNVNELSFILGPTPNATYGTELHYYYYPESIVQRAISGLGTIVPGSGYANQLYVNVPLTGSSSGSTATANIQVTGGAVVSVTVVNSGCYYAVGDSLTGVLGTTGSGFSVPVATVSNASGVTWLGDNFDSALLYGTLCEALTYMKGEPDMVKLVNDRYVQSITWVMANSVKTLTVMVRLGFR
jgi:hypothetical protein